MNMKKLLPLILFLFPLLAYASTTVVSVTPEITNKTEYPPIHRTPPKMPVVTITDNTLLKIENITTDAEIEITILDNGFEIFSATTLDHEISITPLLPAVSYKLLLSINGSLWSGYINL